MSDISTRRAVGSLTQSAQPVGTWNALGQHLTEDKLLKAIERLKENNIKISNLIIDDNWQDVDYNGSDSNSYGLKSFEAQPEAFPNGLRHTVSKIRERFPGIEHITVWQYVSHQNTNSHVLCAPTLRLDVGPLRFANPY